MSEQELPETETTESGSEPKGEVKQDEKKKRTADTLTEDNPLICRGSD